MTGSTPGGAKTFARSQPIFEPNDAPASASR